MENSTKDINDKVKTFSFLSIKQLIGLKHREKLIDENSKENQD